MKRVMVLLAVLLPAVASAQPAPVEQTPGVFGPGVKAGSRVFVIDWAGAEREGEVRSAGSEGLELDERGSRSTIARSAVARIEKTDGLLNGALIGAAISIPLGIASCGEASSKGACYTYGIAFSAGIGALIDWARPGRTVLYRGEKPHARRIDWSVSPTRGGVLARVTVTP
jgi:hypothetical protein